MVTPKFLQGKGTFYADIKIRVNQYFSEKKKPSTGDVWLFSKAIFFCVSYVFLYIHLVFFTPVWWLAIPECLLMAMFTSAIGFNVMHLSLIHISEPTRLGMISYA